MTHKKCALSLILQQLDRLIFDIKKIKATYVDVFVNTFSSKFYADHFFGIEVLKKNRSKVEIIYSYLIELLNIRVSNGQRP